MRRIEWGNVAAGAVVGLAVSYLLLSAQLGKIETRLTGVEHTLSQITRVEVVRPMAHTDARSTVED